MVTGPPAHAVRRLLRSQATSSLKERRVQGKLANLGKSFFRCALEPMMYTQARVPNTWSHLLLPNDPPTVDLTNAAYKILRSVGGSWAERLHSDKDLLAQATAWGGRGRGGCPRQ